MRVAVASEDGRTIAAHTGRCRAIAIFDVIGPEVRTVEHRASGARGADGDGCHDHRSSGAQTHDHSALVDALSDCGVLITRGLGPRLVADLASQGVEAYVCSVSEVTEAVRLFAAGSLPRASGAGCGHHA
jgi:predicted Fe-Mo cluster-binding NifX family protein